jgi:hypothetical protein
LTEPQKPGVRIELEWLLVQFKMGEIHDRPFSC